MYKGQKHNTVEWQWTKCLDNPYFRSLALTRLIWESWARWEHVQQIHTTWMLEYNWRCYGVVTHVQTNVVFMKTRRSATKERVIQRCAPRSALWFQIYAIRARALRNMVVPTGAWWAKSTSTRPLAPICISSHANYLQKHNGVYFLYLHTKANKWIVVDLVIIITLYVLQMHCIQYPT